MAVREDKDRRVGSDPEKLLTLEEAARRLDLAVPEVEAMIQTGRLAAFRLGGDLVRLRLQDVEALRAQQWHALPPAKGSEPVCPVEPPPSKERSSLWGRLSDFFYFNDFYLMAFLVILTLLALILTL